MASKLSNVVLTSFSVKRYRSLRDVSFQPNPTLSILIGPNGAGKTNLLQAIRLLRLPSISPYLGDKEKIAATKSSIAAEILVQGKRVQYRSEILLARSETNNEKIIGATELWNLDAALGTRKGWREYPRFILDPDYRRLLRTRSRVLRNRRGSHAETALVGGAESNILQKILRFANSVQYYSASQFTNPSRCPSSFEIDENERLVDTYTNRGPHLSFLGDLYRLSRNSPDEYNAYIEFVGRGGISLITNVTWKQIELSSGTVEVKSGGRIVKRRKKRVLIVPLAHIGHAHLSFNQLSEGTFRTLALVFYLSTSKSQLLLLEEPEVCVHHGLLSSVVEAIKSHASQKQILVSTHSEFVLDSVSPENVFSVSYGVTKGTSVKALRESMSGKDYAGLKQYLRTTGSLGEYWTHGGLR